MLVPNLYYKCSTENRVKEKNKINRTSNALLQNHLNALVSG